MGRSSAALLTVGLVVLPASFAVPAPARAQVSASVTAETDLRFRGISLTNGKGDVRAALAYDDPSGLYAGAALVIGGGDRGDIHALGYVGYVGYAKRRADGLGLDIGATNSRIADVYPVRLNLVSPQGAPYTRLVSFRYDRSYSEVYAGITKGQLSAHIYLSPDYLGAGFRTAYLDLSGAMRPASRVRLFWHAGLLAPLSRRPGWPRRAVQYDLRAGAALELPQAELQLAWTTTGPDPEYPIGYPQKRDALVLSASTFF